MKFRRSAKARPIDRVNKALARLNPSTEPSRIRVADRAGRVCEQPGPLGARRHPVRERHGLVSKLSDDELTAIVAHLMGHVAYGDDRSWWTEAGPGKKTAVVIGATVLVAAVIAGGGGGGGQIDRLSYAGYSEQQEIDADYEAVRLLAAR